MAITHEQKVASSQSTKFHSVICTFLQSNNGIGFSQYYNSSTVDYKFPVTSVSISDVSGPYTSQPTYSISGTRVTYTCHASSNIDPVKFAATVTIAGGYEPVVITDVQTTSGREINYVKTTSNTYLWARPTTIDLQFPWDAFSAWALVRLSGSKHPDAPKGPVWYQNTKATSGTNTYSFSKIYYGDKLRFEYTAKPGAVVDQDNNYEFTVDPTFSISNIQVEKSALLNPTVELSSQWDFGEGDWDTVKNTSSRSDFKLKVTKPSSAKPLATKVYVKVTAAESFYRNGLNWFTYEDSLVDVYYGDTKLALNVNELIATIPAGTASQEFTLKVSDSKVNYCWPKGIKLTVGIELDSSDHYFTSDYRSAVVSKGTFTSSGGGGGGISGPGYTGGGGTGYGSRW